MWEVLPDKTVQAGKSSLTAKEIAAQNKPTFDELIARVEALEKKP